MTAIQFIQVTPEELEKKILDGVQKIFSSANKQVEPEELLTVDETATFCKATRQSIHNWTKNKKLKAYGIGNRVYYKKSELLQGLQPLND